MTTTTQHGAAPSSQHGGNRIAAFLLAAALDQRLAAGVSAQDSALLAARARRLSSRAQRERLTRDWLAVLDRATRRPMPLSPRMPLRRAQITGAQGDIRLMLAVIQGAPTIGAQGLALARLLLTDGTGPVYNARAGADLAAAVRHATRQMRGY